MAPAPLSPQGTGLTAISAGLVFEDRRPLALRCRWAAVAQACALGLLLALLQGCGAPAEPEPDPQALSLPLNDTGQNLCASAEGALLSCSDPQALAQQDGNSGRDYAQRQGQLSKTGGGDQGFDWLKLGANGQRLAVQNQAWQDGGLEASGQQWRCVKDLHTGLLWEVKLNDPGGLQHWEYKYAWYDTDSSRNAGDPGFADSRRCGPIACQTQAYVAAINQLGLCGQRNWRMPKVQELLSIAHAGRPGLAIDPAYFPNTQASHYWSGQTFALFTNSAWYAYFSDGSMGTSGKPSQMLLRLVADPQETP
jgi:hypothetical protein